MIAWFARHPTAANLFAIISHLQKATGIHLSVRVAAAQHTSTT